MATAASSFTADDAQNWLGAAKGAVSLAADVRAIWGHHETTDGSSAPRLAVAPSDPPPQSGAAQPQPVVKPSMGRSTKMLIVLVVLAIVALLVWKLVL